MKYFLDIGVPILSIMFYTGVAGFIHATVKRYMRKTTWHEEHHHLQYAGGGCDSCMGWPLLVGALWPFSLMWIVAWALLTKEERLEKRIERKERNLLGS